MIFKDFLGGLNTYDPPENIGDNEFEVLENMCYEEGSLLRTRPGFVTTRTATSVRKVYPFYVSGSLHLLYTASGGLYDNGTVVDASFTGTFIAAEYDDMVYLCNGTYYKRYDGTTLYNVGVAAPDVPTVAATDRDEVVLSDFETVSVPAGAGWTRAATPFNGGAGGAVAADAVVYCEGSRSLKLTVSEASKLKATQVFTAVQDWTEFDGVEGSESDYITFKVRVDNPDYLRYFQVLVDVDNGSFNRNYYYTGKIIQGHIYDTAIARAQLLRASALGEDYVPVFGAGETLPLGSPGEWVSFQMPKIDFKREGDDLTKGWNTVKGLGFLVWSNADTGGSTVVVNIDDGVMKGAAGVDGGFYGRYYFCAGYYNSARNEYYEVSEEGDPVDCNVNAVDITGIPATFPDAQADRYQVWARREDWSNWFRVANVEEGTTTVNVGFAATSIINNPELTEQAGIYPLPKITATGEVKTRDNSNNAQPPVPTFIVIHRGKMMSIVGSAIYHTKPGQPWATPVDYYLEATSSSDPVQGMYSDGSNLTIHSKTRDFNYVNAGDYDGMGWYMGYLAQGRRTVGCVAPHSLHSGIYASTFGLSTFDGQDGITLTRKIKPTYRALGSKTSLHGVVYEDFYLLIAPSGDSVVMEMEGVEEGRGAMIRFYEWTFASTPRCCAVDGITNTLYVGTDTGIYGLSQGTYRDSEGDVGFRAWSKIMDFGALNKDLPVQSASVRINTGGNDVTVEFWVDGELGDSHDINTDEKEEVELQLAMGNVGSFLQLRVEGTVTTNAPVRLYQIEIS